MNWRKVLPIFALPLALITKSAFAQGGRDYESDWAFDHMMGWGGGWGGMVLGPVMMVAILVLVIVITVWILRSLGVLPKVDGPTDDALNILERRFASGEIDEAEFQERRRTLGR